MNFPSITGSHRSSLPSLFGKLTRTKHKKPGAAPGTLIYTGPERTEPVKVTVMEYDPERLSESVSAEPDFQEIATAPPVLWVNVDGLNNIPITQGIGSAFDLHMLVLEDIVHTGQRPKLEEFADYLFVVVRMLTLHSDPLSVKSEQVSIILGKEFVLSFQEEAGDVWEPVRERIRVPGSRIRGRGADYLAYALIDAIVDHYFHILERIGDTVEELETEVLDNPTVETMHRIHHLKQEMLVVRRAVWPLRELANGLYRTESPLVSDETKVFLRDVYDHTVQVIDTAETLRDVLSGLMDLYLSSVSNRMNEIMKVLTIMASIFIPLTFLAGIYGMNFETMPELGIPWAYPALLGLMGAIGFGLLAYFRKRGWL